VKTQPTRVASRKKRAVEVNLAMGGPCRGQRLGLDVPTTFIQLYSYISSRTMPPAQDMSYPKVCSITLARSRLSILCFIMTSSNIKLLLERLALTTKGTYIPYLNGCPWQEAILK
jgi:hypothetical protein